MGRGGGAVRRMVMRSLMRHGDVRSPAFADWTSWSLRVAANSTAKCEEIAGKLKAARAAVAAASAPSTVATAASPSPGTVAPTPSEVEDADYASALAFLSGGRRVPATPAIPTADVGHSEVTAAYRTLGFSLAGGDGGGSVGGGGGGGGGGGSGGGRSGGDVPSATVGFGVPVSGLYEGGPAASELWTASMGMMAAAPEEELWGYKLAGPRDGVVGWTPAFEGGRGANPWLKCGGIVRGMPGAPARESHDGPLRRVHFPLGLIDRFLHFSGPNNAVGERGVETCGVLCGRVVNEDGAGGARGGGGGGGALVVSHVVIPAQSAGPDWVEMTREQDLFQYCIDNNLIQIGWIHTHPTQECFMSSYDVRTQLGFQTMLPEAIAVVVAPRDPAMLYGMFRLVEPEGMELVRARPDARPVEVSPGIILYETTPQAKVHHMAPTSRPATSAASIAASFAVARVPTHADDFQLVDLSRGEIGPPRRS
jgi:STAM-binding protein